MQISVQLDSVREALAAETPRPRLARFGLSARSRAELAGHLGETGA